MAELFECQNYMHIGNEYTISVKWIRLEHILQT